MTNTFNAAELRRITDDAIASARQELAQKKEQVLRTAMEHLKVDVIAGRQHSAAMSLKNGADYTEGAGRTRTLKAEDLIGVAALIFKDCQAFAPTIEYWSKVESDMRQDTYTVEGFNIVLHWTDVEDLLTKLGTLNQSTTAQNIRAGIEAAQAAIADKAAAILGQLKEKAATQARAGKDWAQVMSLKAGTDFEKPAGKSLRNIEVSWLGPVARAVWDACASFKPSFEYWSHQESDGRGDSWTVEGINIIIHW